MSQTKTRVADIQGLHSTQPCCFQILCVFTYFSFSSLWFILNRKCLILEQDQRVKCLASPSMLELLSIFMDALTLHFLTHFSSDSSVFSTSLLLLLSSFRPWIWAPLFGIHATLVAHAHSTVFTNALLRIHSHQLLLVLTQTTILVSTALTQSFYFHLSLYCYLI